MLILRILAAFIVIAGTWWSMAEAVWSSDFFQAGIAETMELTWSGERESADEPGLIIVDHEVSPCCRDLDRGRGIAFLVTLFGAAPMATLALILRRRTLPPSLEPLLLVAYVFQFGALVIAGLLTLFFTPFLPKAHFHDLRVYAFLLLTTVLSALALPVWHRLRASAVPKTALIRQAH